MAGEKTRNGGQWTEARFTSFVKGALRQATMKWGPKNEILSEARTRRGFYHCDGCKQEVPATTKEGRKRVKNVHVDHNPPVIDPEIGWQSWDSFIERLFCEKDKLRVLCTACHKQVTDEEKQVAKDRRAKEKENNNNDSSNS